MIFIFLSILLIPINGFPIDCQLNSGRSIRFYRYGQRMFRLGSATVNNYTYTRVNYRMTQSTADILSVETRPFDYSIDQTLRYDYFTYDSNLVPLKYRIPLKGNDRTNGGHIYINNQVRASGCSNYDVKVCFNNILYYISSDPDKITDTLFCGNMVFTLSDNARPDYRNCDSKTTSYCLHIEHSDYFLVSIRELDLDRLL